MGAAGSPRNGDVNGTGDAPKSEAPEDYKDRAVYVVLEEPARCSREVAEFLRDLHIKSQSSREGAFKCKADGDRFVDPSTGSALKFRIDVSASPVEGQQTVISVLRQQGAPSAFVLLCALLKSGVVGGLPGVQAPRMPPVEG